MWVQIKEDERDGACSRCGRDKKSVQSFSCQTKEGRGDIDMDGMGLKEIGFIWPGLGPYWCEW
jgi:hypothetical protein